jgi:uncharacterized protein (DUF2141 family)
MKRVNLLVLALLCVMPVALMAQETFTVTGRVNTPSPEGRVYVFLCDRESFDVPFCGMDTVSYWVNYDKTYVDYEFKNVPAGEYTIRSFQDVNGNHRLDKWIFGPREPWGFSYSGEMKFPPSFDDVSFDVAYDIRVNIVLGN